MEISIEKNLECEACHVKSNQVLVRTEGHLRYENLSRKNVPKHHTSLKALPY